MRLLAWAFAFWLVTQGPMWEVKGWSDPVVLPTREACEAVREWYIKTYYVVNEYTPTASSCYPKSRSAPDGAASPREGPPATE